MIISSLSLGDSGLWSHETAVKLLAGAAFIKGLSGTRGSDSKIAHSHMYLLISFREREKEDGVGEEEVHASVSSIA